MPECSDSNFLEIAIREIGQDIYLNRVILEIDRVLIESESI